MTLNAKITAIRVSPCKKFLIIALKSQLSIYEIRKGSTLVLLKNFHDLKIGTIVQLTTYEAPGPRVCFIDEKGVSGVISLEIGLILTKVKIEEVRHSLSRVDSFDVVRVNPQCVLMAIGGGREFQLTKI